MAGLLLALEYVFLTLINTVVSGEVRIVVACGYGGRSEEIRREYVFLTLVSSAGMYGGGRLGGGGEWGAD